MHADKYVCIYIYAEIYRVCTYFFFEIWLIYAMANSVNVIRLHHHHCCQPPASSVYSTLAHMAYASEFICGIYIDILPLLMHIVIWVYGIYMAFEGILLLAHI